MTGRWDLIVVGAGPAGSSTAYYAARAGLQTLLLDRQSFPRDKPCGDGLMPHAASELSMLGLADWLQEPQHGRFSGFEIHTQTAHLRHPIPANIHGPRGYVIPRRQTDAAILERARAAGAEFLGGVRATGLARSAAGEVSGVEASSQQEDLRYGAPLVITADGVGGFAADGTKAHQNAVACRQYFRGVSGSSKDHLQIFITGDMNRQGLGYGWIFSLPDGRANVGAGVSTATLARTGRNLKDFYARFLEEPAVAPWLQNAEPEEPQRSWSLKTGMWGARRHTQGMMLAGDAASMIHPLSGEGVGYAIESGRLAAAWAHEAHARRDFSASLLSGYSRQLLRLRAREHLSGYALTEALPNMELMEPIFKACETDPAARKTLVESFTGDAPIYRMLGHPLTLARAARRMVGR